MTTKAAGPAGGARQAVLCLNAGSSSVKFAAFDAEAPQGPRLLSGRLEGLGASPRLIARDAAGALLTDQPIDAAIDDHAEQLDLVFDWLEAHAADLAFVVVGHRVVHGGGRFVEPVRVDEEVLAALEAFDALAPLHQPHNLAAIRAVAASRPGLPQVACFDTAFHHTMAPVATRFALPREWSDRGVRRYGFHGLSYDYVARTLARTEPELAKGRVLAAHLGSGASLCAMAGGRSVDTTMGFTALDGLVMGTRPGALDPGVILHMLAAGLGADEVQDLLYRRSGLLGVSGVSSDMRDLEASEAPSAREAIELFVWRVAREAGGLVSAMGGLDGLVFTAGIGENSPAVRAAICARLAWAGVELDPQANAEQRRVISRPSSRTAVLIVPTDEERMIADYTLATIQEAR